MRHHAISETENVQTMAEAHMLEIGDTAPAFSLPASAGKTIALEALTQSGPAVLFFYPRDDTAGCTMESVDFSNLLSDFAKAGATVCGISPDSAKRHDRFRAKHDLKVDLASDETGATARAYGVWVEKNMYGRRFMGIERTTFLVGLDGRIAFLWRKVSVPGHAGEVLDTVRNIARSGRGPETPD